MLKAPIPGFCKTRLARELGDKQAAATIYRDVVERQIREIPSSVRAVVAFTPASAEDSLRNWLGSELEYVPQVEGDLGHRLIAAMAHTFAGGAGAVIFLGGDCPYFKSEHFIKTQALLEEADVVIAPAVDGGYCMLATRVNEPRLFQNITWSTDSVLEETIAACRAAKLAFELLEPMEDIDDQASYERARRSGCVS